MIEKTKLTNGIILLTEQMTEVQTTSIGVLVKSGSIFETNKNNGVSHLIEHLTFKGTKTKTAREIAEELDLIGGQVNAFSAKEYTFYYARVIEKNIKKAIDLLLDIVFFPKISKEDFEKEKRVVLEEIKMYEDSPDEYIHDLLPLKMIKNNSYNLPILGTKESLNKLSYTDLIEYYKNFYKTSNTFISIAGKFNKNFIKDFLIEKLKDENISYIKDLPASMLFNTGHFHLDRSIEQSHLLISFPGVSQLANERFPLSLLNNILAGNMSSRIFQKVRENLGLAYSTFSYLVHYKIGGTISIYAGCAPENLLIVYENIIDEINKIKKHGITDRELEIAKNQYLSSIYLSLENTYNRMLRMAKYEFYFEKNIKIDELTKKIENIPKSTVIDMAEKYLDLDKRFIITLGKNKENFI